MNGFGTFIAFVVLMVTSGTRADENKTRTSAFHAKQNGKDVAATKRGAVQAKLAQAAVDKGVEVAERLANKQLEIWEGQGKKAAEFLKKKIKINVKPDAGWKTENLFVPPGYEVNEEEDAKDDEAESGSVEDPPYNYANGFIGPAIMNGCYGSGYEPGDPCYAPMEATEQCRDMMEGCGFIGVGFDGREEYSPASRRMSIIQRNCAAKGSFGDEQVPDTMNVHGLYDTSSSMITFSSRSEYQKYLQQEAGVSGSYFGFYAGAKKAWGSSSNTAVQTFLSILDIDVTRYEIFKDEVKPSDLSQSFLKEFMSLPTSYFAPRAPLYYQDFIQRWGTHFIKSAKFGGQLEFRKLLQGKIHQTKEEVATQMEVQYKSLFWSAQAKYGSKSGSSQKSEDKTTKTSLEVQGGSQEIASILSDTYSPTFKNEFKEWLSSIPTYPKAFKFTMSPITELLDFRAGDLFPDKFTGGCDTSGKEILSDGKNRYYIHNDKKVYCRYKDRDDVDRSIKGRRRSLERAIEVYMEEGPRSISDISIRAGSPGCQTGGLKKSNAITYAKLKNTETPYVAEIKFDMRDNIVGTDSTITYDMERLIKFSNGNWITSGEDKKFLLYNSFPDAGGNTINVLGMPLTYDQATGTAVLTAANFVEAQKKYGSLETKTTLKDMILAVIRDPAATDDIPQPSPCNVEWDNMNLFQRTPEGKCLHFTAASAGPIYVVFAVIPSKKDSWYYLEISSKRVTIFKAGANIASTSELTERNALGIGDKKLFQTYFVCIREAASSTVIEYGKTHGSSSTGIVYLSVTDLSNPLKVEYYAFGNGEQEVQIANIHVIEGRANLQAECKGQTKSSLIVPYCLGKTCHNYCDPFMGCTKEDDATACGACAIAKQSTTCVGRCEDVNKWPTGKNLECGYIKATFPVVTNEKFVYFEKAGIFPQDMTEITVCLRVKSKSDRYAGTIFSYANEVHENTIILGDHGTGVYFYVRGTAFRTADKVSDGQWHHLCGTWKNDGNIAIWIDGTKVKSQANFRRQNIIKGNGIVWLGQDIDTKYTGQEINAENLWKGSEDAFVGELTAVNMWAKKLDDTTIKDLATSCVLAHTEDQLISWFNVKDFKQPNEGITISTLDECPTFT